MRLETAAFLRQAVLYCVEAEHGCSACSLGSLTIIYNYIQGRT